jgi:membrane-bound metal-dependent hydrolase YbcI (DUF457 family)
MAGHRTHIVLGTAAGAGYAAHRAKNRPGAKGLVRVAGGAMGGALGGALPDIFEPAISSWHRGLGHSVAVGSGLASRGYFLAQWEGFCLEKAEQCRVRPTTLVWDPQEDFYVQVPPNPLSQLLSTLGELFWEFLAGFLNGLVGGYASHLALDAFTPRSIPLLTRGF